MKIGTSFILIAAIFLGACGANVGEPPLQTAAMETLVQANMIILQATAQVGVLTDEANQAPTSTETAVITETEIPTEISTPTATPQPIATSLPPTATVYVAPPPTATLFVPIQATTTSAPKGNCHPSYEGACLDREGDYDCEGGSGDGPNYIKGPIRVVGYDEFQPDRDGDGIACE